jgi:hypothetical protein
MIVMFMMTQRVAIYTQNVVLKRKRTFATNYWLQPINVLHYG